MTTEPKAMTNTDLANALINTGWLDAQKAGQNADIERALVDYQKWWGLKPDGIAGPVVNRSINSPRICALPDRMEARDRLCKWNKLNLTWFVEEPLPGFSMQDMVNIFEEVAASWMRVCALTFKRVGRASRADIVITAGRIDGPLGTLAWSELPCAGDDRQLKQKYDTGERFIASNNPPSGRIDILRTAKHEWGHVIGEDHTNVPDQLMNPTISPIREPQDEYDIAQAVLRYGKPRVDPGGGGTTPGGDPVPSSAGMAFFPNTSVVIWGAKKGTVRWDN